MTITTGSTIWLHPHLLTLVHKANEIFEKLGGSKAAHLTVHWSLVEKSLQVTVVDSTCPQTPFVFPDAIDLESLRAAYQQWCQPTAAPEDDGLTKTA
jgi:hypothetical protein